MKKRDSISCELQSKLSRHRQICMILIREGKLKYKAREKVGATIDVIYDTKCYLADGYYSIKAVRLR